MVVDAATKVWVCDEGHIDDHHYTRDEPGQPELCSRCGGTCEQFSLDGLAREFIELGEADKRADQAEQQAASMREERDRLLRAIAEAFPTFDQAHPGSPVDALREAVYSTPDARGVLSQPLAEVAGQFSSVSPTPEDEGGEETRSALQDSGGGNG